MWKSLFRNLSPLYFPWDFGSLRLGCCSLWLNRSCTFRVFLFGDSSSTGPELELEQLCSISILHCIPLSHVSLTVGERRFKWDERTWWIAGGSGIGSPKSEPGCVYGSIILFSFRPPSDESKRLSTSPESSLLAGEFARPNDSRVVSALLAQAEKSISSPSLSFSFGCSTAPKPQHLLLTIHSHCFGLAIPSFWNLLASFWATLRMLFISLAFARWTLQVLGSKPESFTSNSDWGHHMW